MKWVPDNTGRFEWRPYYDQEELDNACEQLVSSFLMTKNRQLRFPVSTDDLSVLLEQDTSDLDLYADLSREGEDVEAATDFFLLRRPAVRIARELSLDGSMHHRLRTALAHEYGHVKFHSFLWKMEPENNSLLRISKTASRHYHKYSHLVREFSCFRCSRSRIFDAPAADWMEWQAGYVCGAVLMPISPLRTLIREILEGRGYAWVPSDSGEASELASRTAARFDVSLETALARLARLGVLQKL